MPQGWHTLGVGRSEKLEEGVPPLPSYRWYSARRSSLGCTHTCHLGMSRARRSADGRPAGRRLPPSSHLHSGRYPQHRRRGPHSQQHRSLQGRRREDTVGLSEPLLGHRPLWVTYPGCWSIPGSKLTIFPSGALLQEGTVPGHQLSPVPLPTNGPYWRLLHLFFHLSACLHFSATSKRDT